jgi:LysM repeat protein
MKKKYLIIGCVLLLFVLGFYFFSIYSNSSYLDNGSGGESDTREINPVERRQEGEFYSEYRVKEGDTLSSISEYFNLQESTILSANDILQDESLSVGQTLKIPPVDGALITVNEGDTLESIASEYNITVEEIADFNWLDSPYSLEEGMELFIPFLEE